MLLAVNIGNSNIRFGIFDKENCIHTWTVNSKPHKSVDEYFGVFSNLSQQYHVEKKDIQDIVIGSVVPALTKAICVALRKTYQIKPLVVDRDTPSSIQHESDQMGTDLYANAVAAHTLFKSGNKLIIDFGTALTFTAIDAQGKFIGVAISPGVLTSLNSLTQLTSQLPDIELKVPKKVLGKTTETCMQSGIINGYLSMVEGMIERIKTEIGDENLITIATGGLNHIFAPLLPSIQISDKLHTINGLRFLWENLQKK